MRGARLPPMYSIRGRSSNAKIMVAVRISSAEDRKQRKRFSKACANSARVQRVGDVTLAEPVGPTPRNDGPLLTREYRTPP